MMRGLLIILMLVWAGSAPAQESLEMSLARFDAGTELLRSGRYTEALQAFAEAKDAGFSSAALHYNEGIAHYRLDRLGEAIASFERARRLDPENRMVRHNLSISRASIQDKFSQLPPPVSTRLWRWLDATFGSQALFVLGLTGYLAACLLLAMRFMRHQTSEWIRRGFWVSAVLAVVGIGLGLGLSVLPAYPPSAVVIARETPVYATPDDAGSVELQIHEGLTVTVLNRATELSAIRLPNGVTGWVETRSLLDI